MKLKFDQADALDGFRFDVLDAVDVEEVILVIVNQESFHLRRVDATIRLRHVENRHAEIGKDVTWHPIDGDDPGEDCRDDDHENGDRPPKSKLYEVHR